MTLVSEFELVNHVSRLLPQPEMFEHEAAYLRLVNEAQFELAMAQLKAELSQTLELGKLIEAQVVVEAEAWTTTLEQLIADDENPEEPTELE